MTRLPPPDLLPRPRQIYARQLALSMLMQDKASSLNEAVRTAWAELGYSVSEADIKTVIHNLKEDGKQMEARTREGAPEAKPARAND